MKALVFKVRRVAGLNWQRIFTYRFNIIAYRVAEIFTLFATVAIWMAIYQSGDYVGSYTLPEMITYLVVGSFISVLTRSYAADKVAKTIRRGELSLYLTRPMSFLLFNLADRLGTMSFTTLLSAASMLIPVMVFIGYLTLPPIVVNLLIIVPMLVLAFLIEWMVNFLMGLVAFWTVDVGGIFYSINRVREFFAGGFFPLDLLPLWFVKLSFLLPFAYSFFAPTQLYLGKLSWQQGLWGLLVEAVWIGILYGIIRVVWRRGLKKYEGVGI